MYITQDIQANATSNVFTQTVGYKIIVLDITFWVVQWDLAN